jgi:hypothetical protein
MAKTSIPPRKQRTREHIIADLSVHHVEGFVLLEGHTAQRIDQDYGYDLLMTTFDEHGFVEPGNISIQLKASETLKSVGSDYVFDVDIRDYNLWISDPYPVILILYDASKSRAVWLPIQHYFWEDTKRKPKHGTKTVRVRIPIKQVVNRKAISRMRELKHQARLSIVGGGS